MTKLAWRNVPLTFCWTLQDARPSDSLLAEILRVSHTVHVSYQYDLTCSCMRKFGMLVKVSTGRTDCMMGVPETLVGAPEMATGAGGGGAAAGSSLVFRADTMASFLSIRLIAGCTSCTPWQLHQQGRHAEFIRRSVACIWHKLQGGACQYRTIITRKKRICLGQT